MLGSWLDIRQNSQIIRRFSSGRPGVPKHSIKIRSSLFEMREAEERMWQFRVKVNTVLRESVFVVGNCSELGSWNSAHATELTSEAEPDSDG